MAKNVRSVRSWQSEAEVIVSEKTKMKEGTKIIYSIASGQFLK